jgi:hypothetical protein
LTLTALVSENTEDEAGCSGQARITHLLCGAAAKLLRCTEAEDSAHQSKHEFTSSAFYRAIGLPFHGVSGRYFREEICSSAVDRKRWSGGFHPAPVLTPMSLETALFNAPARRRSPDALERLAF